MLISYGDKENSVFAQPGASVDSPGDGILDVTKWTEIKNITQIHRYLWLLLSLAVM